MTPPTEATRTTVLWYAACALFAGGVGVLAGQQVQSSWGRWACGGYAVAALITAFLRRHRLATWVALAGAVVAPLLWLVTGGRHMSRVGMGALVVVNRSGELLLAHGSPYLPADQLTGPESLNPYGPALAVFGLPHAWGLGGWAGNPRLWFGLSAAVLCWLAFRRKGVPGPAHATAFAFASPLLALPFVLGGTDLPVLGLLVIAFALLLRPAGTSRPDVLWAGAALGLACAMKATAWPAALVLLPMLLVRDGRAAAARFAAAGALTGLIAFAVTVPAAVFGSADLLRNTVLFPLRFTPQKTTAASPLPGHLIATSGPAGNVAMTVVLAAAVLAACVWVVRRPPGGPAAAVRQLAVVYAVIFALAPASRFGYYIYPLALLGWWAVATRTPAGPVRAQLRRDRLPSMAGNSPQ